MNAVTLLVDEKTVICTVTFHQGNLLIVEYPEPNAGAMNWNCVFVEKDERFYEAGCLGINGQIVYLFCPGLSRETGEDQRKFNRMRIEMPAAAILPESEPVTVTIKDISFDGCSFVMEEQESAAKFTFEAKGKLLIDHEYLAFAADFQIADVVVAGAERRIGVSFTHMKKEYASLLHLFLLGQSGWGLVEAAKAEVQKKHMY